MRDRSIEWLLADATDAVSDSSDLAGILARLLDDCASALSCAAGIMVRLPDGTADVAGASSHQSLELELYQSQADDGPCIQSMIIAAPIEAAGLDEIRRQWSGFGDALADAGYTTFLAQPMIWQDTVIGALNVFRSDLTGWTDDERELARAFANIATIAMLHAGLVNADQAVERAQAALASRNIIEQAKGFLSYDLNIDMSQAYQRLRELAIRTDRSLTETAADVLGATN